MATVESLHIAYHRIELASGSYEVYVGGRYLDRCELVGDDGCSQAAQWSTTGPARAEPAELTTRSHA